MRKILAIIMILLVPCLAFSEERKTIKNPSEIAKIISSIPVTDEESGYKNIGERMEKIGIHATSIWISLIKKEDIEPGLPLIAGDKVVRIFTNNPDDAVKSVCPILGSPEYIKRGNKYIPYNRTAYWLMRNRCDFK